MTWARLLAILPTVLLVGQASDVKHEEVLTKLLDSLGQMTKTLETVTDAATAESARPELKKQADEFREIRKSSEKLPPPAPDVRDRIAKDFQPKFIATKKELDGQIARVRLVEGTLPALSELRGVFLKD